MRNRLQKVMIISLCLSLLSPLALGSSSMSITPVDYSYHEPAIALGTTLTVPYLIKNNSPIPLFNVTAKRLPSGITSSNCAKIVPYGSCQLKLKIPAELTNQPGVIRSRFQVCAGNAPFTCTWVEAKKQLNITVTNMNTFLAITDIHFKAGKSSAITYGQDTGDSLWSSTQAELTTLIAEQAPKFIVLLGDLPAHHDDENLEKNISAVLQGFSGLEAISQNDMPVFYVFGNNDSLVVDYGTFSTGTTNLFSLDPQHNSPETKGWPALNANPDCNVSPTTACTYTTTHPMPTEHADDMAYAQTDGYYSAYPLGSASRLRLISLNSVIFSHEYALTGASQLAAAQKEMDWLAAQLASAAANGDAVYLAMHIPVGNDAFNHSEDMWNSKLVLGNGKKFRDNFLSLMSQYQDTVRIFMAGHTHLSELRALYADTALTNLSVLGVGIPSITPQHYNNPGLQVYLYDNNYRLNEAKTFFTTPNASNWKNYSFQDDYSCPKNTSMLECVQKAFLPQLSDWKFAPQPIPHNRYEMNFSLRAPYIDPSTGGLSSWLEILNAIQVVPTQD